MLWIFIKIANFFTLSLDWEENCRLGHDRLRVVSLDAKRKATTTHGMEREDEKKLNIRHHHLLQLFFENEKFMVIYAEFFHAPYFFLCDFFGELSSLSMVLTLMWDMCVVCTNIKFIFVKKNKICSRSPIQVGSLGRQRYKPPQFSSLVDKTTRQRKIRRQFFLLVKWTARELCVGLGGPVSTAFEFISWDWEKETYIFMTSKISQISRVYICIQYFSFPRSWLLFFLESSSDFSMIF